MASNKDYEIVRIDLDTWNASIHRAIRTTVGGLEGIKEHCRRMNGFNVNHDFSSYYLWREKPKHAVSGN